MAGKWTSLKGQLLLDGGNLQGSFFHRTVVLVCQHDQEGAFGLVLNRSSDKRAAEVLDIEIPERLREQRIFLGGPVQPGALSYLQTDALLPSANVFPNLDLGHSLEQLIEIGESFSPAKKVRIFAGYSGWSPGQLDAEMERKAWLTHPASLDLIFGGDPATLWQRILLDKQEFRYRLLAESPDDLSWN